MSLSVEMISYGVGAALIAIAIIGGGLTAKGTNIPKIPLAPRVLLSLFGATLIGYSVWSRAVVEEETFEKPVYGDYRLDVCLVFSGDCQGGHAATRWCRKEKHFGFAADYDVDANAGVRSIKTKTIGNDDICQAEYCSTYRYITCRDA